MPSLSGTLMQTADVVARRFNYFPEHMTKQEHNELDAWIAEHVFDLKFDPASENWFDPVHPRRNPKAFELPKFTTDPAVAMEVLKKCALKSGRCLEILFDSDDKWVVSHDAKIVSGVAETLELAICLFARQLFS